MSRPQTRDDNDDLDIEAALTGDEQEKPTSPPPIVFVKWRDSYLASDGWTDREECAEAGRGMTRDPIYSAGFLIDDSATGVIVASGFNHHSDEVVGSVAIPRSAIESIAAIEREATAATPDEAYYKGWTAGYYKAKREAAGKDSPAAPSEDDERTYTEEEYIDYGVIQYRRGSAQAKAEADGKDIPATPSLDQLIEILDDAEGDGIIGPDYTPPRLAEYILARLDEGSKDSGRPNEVVASATPDQGKGEPR